MSPYTTRRRHPSLDASTLDPGLVKRVENMIHVDLYQV